MHPIIYDVAVSIDGYISGPMGDISKFPGEGPVVEDYAARLAGYSVAIMGRATYEFGYRFGLEPGRNPYPHMQTIVFSQSLTLPEDSAVAVRKCLDAGALADLKARADGPVYLCGGGRLAGSLLALGALDKLRLKRAPILLGGGVRLFGPSAQAPRLSHVATRPYEGGYLFQEFDILK